jgi:hypothetical protein
MTSADRIQFWNQHVRGQWVVRLSDHYASWVARHCLVVAIAALFSLPPFEAMVASSAYASDGSAVVSTDTDEKDTAKTRPPLSLAYVPRDAYVIAAIRPTVFLKSDSLSHLKRYLAEGMRQVGVVPEHIEQMTLMYFSKESSIAYVVHMSDIEAATKLATSLVPDPVEHLYAGRKYLRKQDPGGACTFSDGNIVVVAPDEEHLRRLIIAGPDGAAKAKWTQVWQAAADSDGLAIANIKALRGLAALDGHRNLSDGLPPEMDFAISSSTARMAVKVDGNVHVNLRLDGHSGEDGMRIEAAIRSLIDRFQVTLALHRIDVSKHGSDEGAVWLSLLDLVDSLLDNVTIQTGEDTVELSAKVDQDSTAKIMKAIDAGYSRE